jgi:hypothetical protein
MLLCVQAAALGLGKIVQANHADEFVRWCRVRQSPLCAQVSAWAINSNAAESANDDLPVSDELCD